MIDYYIKTLWGCMYYGSIFIQILALIGLILTIRLYISDPKSVIDLKKKILIITIMLLPMINVTYVATTYIMDTITFQK